MAGRTRRVRLIVLLVFGVVAFMLYNRNATAVDDYRQYYKDKVIGGGSVIRPKPKEAPKQPPAAAAPELELESTSPPRRIISSTPPPVKPAKRPESTTSTKEGSSTATPADPTPAPALAPNVPPEDYDVPYQVGEGRVEVEVVPSPTTTILYWSKMPENFPVSTTIQLPSGSSKPMPRIQRAINKLSTNGADKERLAVIKGATEHAWRGYKEFAFAADEVRPVSGRMNNPFNGWGATLVDSLDTLWLMGMTAEFEDAVEAVKNIDFTTSPRSDIPVFETTIRYLGGLIAAYDVSGKKYITLLAKAVEIAEVLFSIFDTPNRMPQTFYRWKPSFASQPHRAGTRVILAEIGTLSLEFTRLAQLTGEPKYYDAIARITDAFEEWQNSTRLPGMWPTSLDASGCGKPAQIPVQEQQPTPDDSEKNMVASEAVKTGEKDSESQKSSVAGPQVPDDPALSNRKRQLDSGTPAPQLQKLGTTGSEVCLPQGLASTSKNTQETYTLSGASDSMYEYFPKEYVLLAGLVDQYRTMYLDSANTFIEKLLYKPMTIDERDILMTGELKITPNYSQPIEDREYIETFKPEAAHLACFAGGMIAMGGVLFDKPEHVEIGSKLTDGCVWAYNVTSTGIMPEGAELMMCDDTWGDCPWNETAWWKELDPFEESRLKTPTPGRAHHKASDNEAVPAPAPVPAPAAAEIAPHPKIDLEKKTPDSAANLNKRQLGEASIDVPKPPMPAPAVGAGPNQNSQTNENPVYTPEKPLSHEEFVRKKIEEERIPPGYIRMTSRKYILRPEAIESVFYMYRITGEQYWRDVGWNMFMSIDSHTRAPHGNSAIDDITKSAPDLMDQMESFWIAETLKYFYLLYDDPDNWSLDEWVLNTEAHLFHRNKFEFADV